MQEIGGYLELEDFNHQEYYPNLISLNTARNALVYLCCAKKIQKIYLPCFLCDSVSHVCDREGIPCEFYHIGGDFKPLFERKLLEGEYLYLVNYYGQLSQEDVLFYQRKYERIILDNVQAFFSEPIPGVDTIYSCRKFFGVPDGAYLSTDSRIKADLPTDCSMDRMRHLLGRYEGNSASDYYRDFKENDASFVTLPLMYMSKLTHNLLGAVNYELVKSRRNENWTYLHDLLADKNKLLLVKPEAPYMYPFYCENGMEIKRNLAQKRIYIPTLWPNVLESDGNLIEKEYAENILPLPIDQRYSLEMLNEMVCCLLKIGVIV